MVTTSEFPERIDSLCPSWLWLAAKWRPGGADRVIWMPWAPPIFSRFPTFLSLGGHYKTNSRWFWGQRCCWVLRSASSPGFLAAPVDILSVFNSGIHVVSILNWLVVSTYPSEKWSSSDWIIIPTIGENKSHVPNHQPVNCVCPFQGERNRKKTTTQWPMADAGTARAKTFPWFHGCKNRWIF